MNKDETDNKIEIIASLKQGWNGKDAPAMPHELIEKVRWIVEQLDIQPELFPTAMQTIQFEYDNARQDHMEIEVGSADTAEVFLACHNGAESYEKLLVDPNSFRERMHAFMNNPVPIQVAKSE